MTIPTIATIGTPAVLLVLCLFRGLKESRGSTLHAPIVWALFATAGLALDAVVESLSAGSEQGIGLSSLRFAAAAGTFCPLMAVLGAKRPQNRGWQWVVLTLWIVVVWPAAQAVLIPTGLRLELSVVWKLFLVGLVWVGLLNYLPTRNWLAAFFVAGGQLVLLDSYLWRWSLVDRRWVPAIGLGCFLVAATLVWVRQHRKRKKDDPLAWRRFTEFDQHWLDFRDAYGALWALRILARVNQAAEVQDWPMRLGWSGFTLLRMEDISIPSAEQLGKLQTTMATLLRRFV